MFTNGRAPGRGLLPTGVQTRASSRVSFAAGSRIGSANQTPLGERLSTSNWRIHQQPAAYAHTEEEAQAAPAISNSPPADGPQPPIQIEDKPMATLTFGMAAPSQPSAIPIPSPLSVCYRAPNARTSTTPGMFPQTPVVFFGSNATAHHGHMYPGQAQSAPSIEQIIDAAMQRSQLPTPAKKISP